MNPHDLTGWLQHEHDRAADLAIILKKEIAAMPCHNPAPWLARVRENFAHFRAHIVRHMALEEKDGYLLPVIERRPTLTAQVEALRHEHRQVAAIMDSVHRNLEHMEAPDRLLIDDCCQRIDHLMMCLEHHHEREALLLMFALNQDIGSKD